MRMPLLTVCGVASLIAGIGLLVAADDLKDEATRKDRNLYEGTWRVMALEADGTKMSEDDCAKVVVINELNGRWTVKAEGAVIWRGISKIDPTTRPSMIDFTPTEGADVGKLFLGIYEIGSDTRRLCYSEPDKGRPTEFSTEPGSGRVLVTFKREKSIALLPQP